MQRWQYGTVGSPFSRIAPESALAKAAANGNPVGSASFRDGVTPRVTAEGHAEGGARGLTALPELAVALVAAQKAKDAGEVAALIVKHGLPREAVPPECLAHRG